MPPVPSVLRRTNPLHLAILLLLALTGYRLWFCTRMELVPDEAYYWLWSKHLAASYRDKGPAIAWTIALGTRLFGDTVFGIRIFAVLLSTGIGCLLFALARRLYDDRTALWCLLISAVMPILAVGAILMTIDSLSLFSWSLAALLFWIALHSGKSMHWFWLGLVIGGGFLAKFTNGVQLICIALFLLWSKEHRPLLFSRKMFIMGAAFLAAIVPILWWNVQTGWIHAAALHSRSGVKDSFGIHPLELLRFIGEEFGVISPLFMAGIIAAAVGLLWKRHADLRTRFLLSQSLPLFALFLFFSLNKAGKSNWIAPALIPSILFTVVFWREVVSRWPAWRWAVGTAFWVALVMTAAIHDTSFLRLPPEADPLRRSQGWADFRDHVQRARLAHNPEILIGNHYSMASMMTFYLSDRPVTYLPPEEYGSSQFSLWPTYDPQAVTRALFVTSSMRGLPKALEEQFSKIEMVDDFMSQHRGRPMTRFRIYLCAHNSPATTAR